MGERLNDGEIIGYPLRSLYDKLPTVFGIGILPKKDKCVLPGDIYDTKFYKCSGGWGDKNCKAKIEVHYKCRVLNDFKWVAGKRMKYAKCIYDYGPSGDGYYRWEHSFKLIPGTNKRSKYFLYGIIYLNFRVKS